LAGGGIVARDIVAPVSREVRIGAALLALVACAWFGLAAVESHDVSVATAIVSAPGEPGPGAIARAASALSSASFLNPDRTVDVLKGRLDIESGRVPQARSLLRAVTRAEPRNLDAWIWFTGASINAPAAARIGASRIAELDPLDAKAVGR
jgi:hypothetical protein